MGMNLNLNQHQHLSLGMNLPHANGNGGLGASLGAVASAAGLGNVSVSGMGSHVGSSPGPGSAHGSVGTAQDDEKIYALVIDLMDPETRDTALLELSKKREQYDDLALVLWHSFGMSFHLLFGFVACGDL
jgi:hypothetical protein